jgi:hypothetical protein
VARWRRWLARWRIRDNAFEGGEGTKKDNDVNPVKNNETQQRKGTQDRSMDRFEWKTSTHCL